LSTKNDTFLRALRGQVTDYTPVWLMRQAGRYLPEYNATRARAGSFMALCKTPELACEVTLQPLARFPLDAAILFSDILTIPDAMNLGLSFQQGEGPRFEKTIRHEDDVKALFAPDPTQELRYVLDAVRTLRHALDGRGPVTGPTCEAEREHARIVQCLHQFCLVRRPGGIESHEPADQGPVVRVVCHGIHLCTRVFGFSGGALRLRGPVSRNRINIASKEA